MVHEVLVAAKLVVLGLGAAIAFVGFLGWRRTRDRLMLWVAVAFSALAIGSSAEGTLYELLAWDLTSVHTVESAAVLVGLTILLWVLRPPARKPASAGAVLESDEASLQLDSGQTEGTP